MNASISPEVLGRIAVQSINDRLNMRAELLFGMRERLKCFTRMNGRLTAKEAQDWVCLISEILGNDIRELKDDFTELSMQLEAAHYGDHING